MGALATLLQLSAATVPSAYTSIIIQEGNAQGVDPALIAAVIQVESSFRPDAVNPEPTGQPSYGLMQLQLATARDMAGDSSLQSSDLMDPSLNIALGTKYLRYQLDRYGGNEAMAAAAYNAGSARYRAGSSQFVNQTYVDRVLGAVSEFRQAGSSDAVLPSAEVSDTPPIDWSFGDWRLWAGILVGLVVLLALARD